MNCKLVLSLRSQFFHSLRHLSSQAKERSTIHRFGMTTKVCSSLRFSFLSRPHEYAGFITLRSANRHERRRFNGSRTGFDLDAIASQCEF